MGILSDAIRANSESLAMDLAAFQAEPVRQIELRETEMGLISLAISTMANSKGWECLSGYDRVALAELERRVALWRTPLELTRE